MAAGGPGHDGDRPAGWERSAGPGHRARLTRAVTQAVAEKGYARATVADVVRIARVSRRTFYEHFTDKEDCFLTAYEEATSLLLHEVVRATVPHRGWREQLRAGMDAYLRVISYDPVASRVFLFDLLQCPHGLERRREVHARTADIISRHIRMILAATAELRGIAEDMSPALARGVIGAVVELLYDAFQSLDGPPDLAPVEEAAVELLEALVLRKAAAAVAEGRLPALPAGGTVLSPASAPQPPEGRRPPGAAPAG